MIKTILIDDEKSSLESLAAEIGHYCPSVEILATYQDLKLAKDMIIKMKPNVIFLDIGMPQMNGFEFLQQFDEIDFDVIFVTAYDEYAIKAFEFNAIDYLLKPVMVSKLQTAVDRVKNSKVQFSNDQLQALITNLQIRSKRDVENIAIPCSDGFEFVNVHDILYLQADNNYCWVHLISGKKYLVSKPLKQMESMFPLPQFLRVHKTFTINLNHAIKYIRGQGGEIIMKNGKSIPVSRTKKEVLLSKLRIS